MKQKKSQNVKPITKKKKTRNDDDDEKIIELNNFPFVFVFVCLLLSSSLNK